MTENPENLTDKELVKQYRSLYQRIEENKGGVGTSDLRRYSDVQEEVESRGMIVETKVEIRDGTTGEVIEV